MKTIVVLCLFLIGCGPGSFPTYIHWPPEAQGKAR